MAILSSAIRLRTAFLALLSAPVVLLGGRAGELVAQEARVRVEENFRAEPNGTLIGRLDAGTPIRVQGAEGSWTQVTVEGYVWAQSLQVRTSGSYDLIVAASEGENLRDAPSGRILGRLENGTLLEEVERIPGWIRVRRTAWLWTPSVSVAAAAPAPAPTPAAGTSTTAGGTPSTPPAATPTGAPRPATAAAPAAGAAPDGWVRSGADGTRILNAPDGGALGRVEPGADLRVVAREGNWARVQLEGWIWMPTLDSVQDEVTGDPTILTGVRIRELSTNFDRYRGRLVAVELQFISLERAEQVRSDFYEGEPFLLTRSVDQDRSFVYVAVPAGRLTEVQTLAPLETIRVVGRVRSGAAAFTGSPILDLMELTRTR